jgi:hypothetical protein
MRGVRVTPHDAESVAWLRCRRPSPENGSARGGTTHCSSREATGLGGVDTRGDGAQNQLPSEDSFLFPLPNLPSATLFRARGIYTRNDRRRSSGG